MKMFLAFVYQLCLLYFIFIEVTYFYFKRIKKDIRFLGVGFFKYLENPIRTLRGQK